MKILAIGASNSQHSINRALAKYAAQLVNPAQVEVVDLRDYELPLFSMEREQVLGQPAHAQAFYNKIANAEAIVISFAEHNGSYTAAYKNLFDWTSRIDKEVFQHKPMLLLSTSPGAGGAASVLASAVASAPHFGARVAASLSIPSFHQNFDEAAQEIRNPQLRGALQAAAASLRELATAAN